MEKTKTDTSEYALDKKLYKKVLKDIKKEEQRDVQTTKQLGRRIQKGHIPLYEQNHPGRGNT